MLHIQRLNPGEEGSHFLCGGGFVHSLGVVGLNASIAAEMDSVLGVCAVLSW